MRGQLVVAAASPSRDLQQTTYRIVFKAFLFEMTYASPESTTCSSSTAQIIRNGFEDCLRTYNRQRCGIDAAFIGLGGAECVSDNTVSINGGVFSFSGMDVLPERVAQCVLDAANSETCMQTFRTAVPELGTIAYAVDSPMPTMFPTPSPSLAPSISPTNAPTSSSSMSPSEYPSLVPSFNPTISPSLTPTIGGSSEFPSSVPVDVPTPDSPVQEDSSRVPTTTSGIVTGAVPRSQKAKTIPITASTVGVALAVVLVLLGFVMKKRGGGRSNSKAHFKPMDDDDDNESNASGLIGIAPMQAMNGNGDLEQAVEISIKNPKYKESTLNTTFSTAASSSPNASAENIVLPDIQKRFKNISASDRQNSLSRPDVTPRRTRSRSNSIPFDDEDDEMPSNPKSNPSPVVVKKEVCGSSWWKQMNSGGKKVRNPVLCPYSPLMDGGMCCPQSVPGMIVDKSLAKDDVSDFEVDGTWDPDDTSVPSSDGDRFYTSQLKSVASDELPPKPTTSPSTKDKPHLSRMLPPLTGRQNSFSENNDTGSKLLLGASSRRQSGFQMDRIVSGSEAEV